MCCTWLHQIHRKQEKVWCVGAEALDKIYIGYMGHFSSISSPYSCQSTNKTSGLDFKDKKRQLTVLELHRTSVDNFCLLAPKSPQWLNFKGKCHVTQKMRKKCGLDRAQTAKSLRWSTKSLIRLSMSDLWFQMNLCTTSENIHLSPLTVALEKDSADKINTSEDYVSKIKALVYLCFDN